MKSSLLVLVFIFLVVFNAGSSQRNIMSPNYDKAQIEDFVNKYISLLINYADCPNRELAIDKRRQLVRLFENRLFPHSFDLFNNEDNEQIVDTYILNIENNYNNKIEMEFSNVHIYTCTEEKEGVKYAFVTADKTLTYEGKTRNVKVLLGINITTDDYKINQVVFPEEYITSKGKCSLDETIDENKSMYEYNRAIADIAFKKNDYVSAKKFYEKALNFEDDDVYSLSQIKKCNDFLNYSSYKTNADNEFNKSDFNKAKKLYEKILKDYPENKNYAQDMIVKCNQKIKEQTFEDIKADAEDYYKRGIYNKAKEYYLDALNYKSNDAYVLDMVKKCDMGDKNKVQNELQRARNLVSQNTKESYAEAIKTYTYFEPSGMLTAKDYYTMASILDMAYAQVNKILGYGKNHSYFLAKEYCLKSKKLGSQDATEMWLIRFNNKSRNRK
jgi:tetratricopeptide (TPR) repeat protein